MWVTSAFQQTRSSLSNFSVVRLSVVSILGWRYFVQSHNLLFQISCDFGELSQRGLEIFYDFGGDNVGIREVGAVFEAFVFEPEDVEVKFVALD